MNADISRLDTVFDDWQGLLQLVLNSFAYMDGVIDPPSSALRLTPESLARKAGDEIVFLATEEDGNLLGCMFCRAEPPECLYVGKLAVLPRVQGHGIGSALMAEAEALATDLGLPELRLETRIELTGNHARFARMGFRVVAEGRHAGFDRTTFVEMRKRLAG